MEIEMDEVTAELEEMIQDGLVNTDQIGEAGFRFRKRVMSGEKGVVCPCCHRPATLRKRMLNSGLARTLILINRHPHIRQPTDGWVRVSEELKDEGVLRNREYQRLRFWDLLEPHHDAKRTMGKNSNDTYRVTANGVRFVLGDLCVRKYAYTYDNICWGFGDEVIDIAGALANRFDYAALMRGDG